MYNIDQQLFDYCTAKTLDNVQCCIPVIDNTHELPLCLKHARDLVSLVVSLGERIFMSCMVAVHEMKI
jgi:hypothetical protein